MAEPHVLVSYPCERCGGTGIVEAPPLSGLVEQSCRTCRKTPGYSEQVCVPLSELKRLLESA